MAYEIRLYRGFALDLHSICLETSNSSPVENPMNCIQSPVCQEASIPCATDNLLYRVGIEHIKVLQSQQFGRGYGSRPQLPIIDPCV